MEEDFMRKKMAVKEKGRSFTLGKLTSSSREGYICPGNKKPEKLASLAQSFKRVKRALVGGANALPGGTAKPRRKKERITSSIVGCI